MQRYIQKLTNNDIKEILKLTDSPFTLPVDLAINLKDRKGNKINPITRFDKTITDVDKMQLTCIIPDEKNIRKKVVCDFVFNDYGCTTLNTYKLKLSKNYTDFLCSQMDNLFVKYCSKKFGHEYIEDYTNYHNKTNTAEQTLEM